MTASPQTQAHTFDSAAQAIAWLRGSGLRISTPRRLVLEALFAAEGPVSAAHLSNSLALEESSVYRNLELLEQHGIARHLHLGHSPGLYALTSEHEVEYLYCERCGKITAVAPEQIDTIRGEIRRRFGYTPRFTHFAIVGTCEDCAAIQTGRPAGRTMPVDEASHLHSHGNFVHSHPGSGSHSH